MYASYKGHFKIVKILIEKYADVNIQNEVFFYYYYYYYYYYLFIIFFLLLLYSNVKSGYTALIIASEQGQFENVKLLIENNADLNVQNKVFF
jgi:ankyrin repeat protein